MRGKMSSETKIWIGFGGFFLAVCLFFAFAIWKNVKDEIRYEFAPVLTAEQARTMDMNIEMSLAGLRTQVASIEAWPKDKIAFPGHVKEEKGAVFVSVVNLDFFQQYCNGYYAMFHAKGLDDLTALEMAELVEYYMPLCGSDKSKRCFATFAAALRRYAGYVGVNEYMKLPAFKKNLYERKVDWPKEWHFLLMPNPYGLPPVSM